MIVRKKMSENINFKAFGIQALVFKPIFFTNKLLIFMKNQMFEEIFDKNMLFSQGKEA